MRPKNRNGHHGKLYKWSYGAPTSKQVVRLICSPHKINPSDEECLLNKKRDLAILCDLFGIVKWPFSLVKWPPTRGWKGHFESPGMCLFVWFRIEGGGFFASRKNPWHFRVFLLEKVVPLDIHPLLSLRRKIVERRIKAIRKTWKDCF